MFHYHSSPTTPGSSSPFTDPVLPLSFQMLSNRPSHSQPRTHSHGHPYSHSHSHPYTHPAPPSGTTPLLKPKPSHYSKKRKFPTQGKRKTNLIIRPATLADIPACVDIEISANKSTPIVSLPWPSLSSSVFVFTDRHLFMLSHPDSYQFLIAASQEGEIIGFLIGHRPVKEGEEEWHPKLPPGTDEGFVEWYVRQIKGEKERIGLKERGYWELDTLAVKPNWQRQGVGRGLVAEWLKGVDAEAGAIYVMSSPEGKGLYENFRCREVGKLELEELERWGYEGDRMVLSHMIREGGSRY